MGAQSARSSGRRYRDVGLRRHCDKMQAFELGADDYVIKPFRIEELVVALMPCCIATPSGLTDAVSHLLQRRSACRFQPASA